MATVKPDVHATQKTCEYIVHLKSLLGSAEGKEAIAKAVLNAKQSNDRLSESSRLDTRTLKMPMTK